MPARCAAALPSRPGWKSRVPRGAWKAWEEPAMHGSIPPCENIRPCSHVVFLRAGAPATEHVQQVEDVDDTIAIGVAGT